MRKCWILCLLFAVYLSANAADEQPSAIADLSTLSVRVAELEKRVTILESLGSEKPAKSEEKPILEVDSEKWCAPCRAFEADVIAYGELPIEIRPVDFSEEIPAFRWKTREGKTVTRKGYVRGSLKSLVDAILADQ